MRSLCFAAGLAVAMSVGAARADGPVPPAAPPQAQRVKGVIDSFDAVTRMVGIATRNRKIVSVTLRPDARILYDEKRGVAGVKVGDFIGVAALKGADGKLHAQQVDVFPEAWRGMGEGQYPMGDAGPNRVMTNATVAQLTGIAANSGTLTLSYRGAATAPDGSCAGHANAAAGAGCSGTADIVVAAGVPIIALMLGDESLLVPGAAVSLIATTATDGTLQAARLTVEKDGVKPVP